MDVCVDVCLWMCVDVCVWMCVWMCLDVCVDVCECVCGCVLRGPQRSLKVDGLLTLFVWIASRELVIDCCRLERLASIS